MFGDADLPLFFADFGVAVVFASNSAKGIFDKPMQNSLAEQGYGGVLSTLPSVHLPYNAFSPMPTTNDALVVNGTNYTVAVTTAEGDGAVITYELKAVSL